MFSLLSHRNYPIWPIASVIVVGVFGQPSDPEIMRFIWSLSVALVFGLLPYTALDVFFPEKEQK